MQKEQIIANLEEMAMLMQLKGENSFKIRAFHNAINALEAETKDLYNLAKNNELTTIKGIGEGIGKKIAEMLLENKNTWLDELREEIPQDLVKMLDIPGLGAKKIQTIHKNLGITTLEDLEKACLENKIAELPKFGNKVQQNIIKGLESLRQNIGKFLYSFAHAEGQKIVAYIKECPGIEQIEIAGSLRRKKEVTKDVDILVVASNPTTVMKHFVDYPQREKIINHGDKKSSIQLKKGLQVDLRVVTKEQFPFALMYFTGSKEHNTEMRSIAKKKGLKLNEYGLFAGETSASCVNETEVFSQLELEYIEPELRENLGEIELAHQKKLPLLMEQKQLQGIFHMHTNYSDGAHTIREMAQEAIDLGYKYIGITDHSQSLTIGNGMKPASVLKQFAEIDAVNKELKPFHIFKGVESDILADGSLDYDAEILEQFDFIIGSVHGNFRMSEAEMTKRVIKAIENPHLTMLGHPTGRLLLKREPYSINMREIIDAAVANNVIIEINAHPWRLDLDWRWGKYAYEKKLYTSINPDSHTKEGFFDLLYGVGIARKAWFEADKVINTWDLQKVIKWFKKRG